MRSLQAAVADVVEGILSQAEVLRKAHERSHEEFDELFDESTKTILQEVERLRTIIDEFSRFARLPRPELRETDLRTLVTQAASLHDKAGVAIHTHLPGAMVTAMVDQDQRQTVLDQWGGTPTDYPRDLSIQQVFEQRRIVDRRWADHEIERAQPQENHCPSTCENEAQR